ncbi:Uncharacterised protein [uncultured archaeon]|nr:Uncharacterised protein [uncultured archaeon]
MLECIAGTRITGIFEPSAVLANVVTGVSSIPCAIFPRVFAVHGETRRRSARDSDFPQSEMCSQSPERHAITGLPVAQWNSSGRTRRCAASLTTQKTSAPFLMSSRAKSMERAAATLPVMQRQIFFPESALPLDPMMDFEECIYSRLLRAGGFSGFCCNAPIASR